MSIAQTNNDIENTDPSSHEVASELREFKWRGREERRNSSAARPSVDEFLRERHRRSLLERLPSFENDTLRDIAYLRNQVESLRFRLFVTNVLIAMALCVAVFLRLF